MSLNQYRAEKTESLPNKKLGRSGSSAQPRNSLGGGGKGGGGGGAAAPPASSSITSSLSSNRSFKKSNNAQGGQYRISNVSVNSDSNNASAALTAQNDTHLQPQLHGVSDVPVKIDSARPTNISTQKSTRGVPRAPSSRITAPATPTKAPADVSTSFQLQFGSIIPGLQIPARTSSAPPNFDEQKRDQLRHDSLRAIPSLPIPSAPKQQQPKKDAGDVDQFNTYEAHSMPKAKKEGQILPVPPSTKIQKPAVHPIPGIPMQMSFNQPQVAVQFGGANPQIQTQGMPATSLPMPMPMPLQIGSHPVQHQIFVPSLQSPAMQPQGIMHHGQSLNFTSQMGPQMPPQLGNLGINITPQFPQQQVGKLGGHRKPVKITHPDTHEELKLDRKTDTIVDGGLSGLRSHPIVSSQSPSISSFPSAQPINYYADSHNASSLFFPTAPQPLRFNYPVSQAPLNVSFNQSTVNSFGVGKTVAPSHGSAEATNLEHSRDNKISSAPSASVQVTVKPAAASNRGDSSLSIDSSAVEMGSPKLPRLQGEATSIHPPKNSEISLQQSKAGLGSSSTSLPTSSKQSTAASISVSAESLAFNTMSSAPAPLNEAASAVTSGSESRRRNVNSQSDPKDQQKKSGKKGHSQPQHQVDRQSASTMHLPSQSSEHISSFNSETPETMEAKTSASPGTTGGVLETSGDSLLAASIYTSDASDLKTATVQKGSVHESLEMIGGADPIANFSKLDDCTGQHDLSPQVEHQNLETAGTKGQKDSMSPHRAKQDDSLETSLEFVSSKSSEELNQTEHSSVSNLTSIGYEVGPLGTARMNNEKSQGFCKVDEKAIDDLVTSSSYRVLGATNAETSSSSVGLSTAICGNMALTSDVSSSRSDSMGGRETGEFGTLYQELALGPVQSLQQVTLKQEREATESLNSGLVSLSASSFSDKSMLEHNRAKSMVARGKKKRKEILQKADAAGTTSDLYMAYKGPEEKKETAVSLEGTSSNNLKQVAVDADCEDVSSEKDGQTKAEPDDWEDAANISTPKMETSNNDKQVNGGLKSHGEDGNGVIARKYTRDFLLKFSEQCTDLPQGCKISPDVADVHMTSNVAGSRDSYPSMGRILDRPTGGSRPDRHGRGVGDDDKWNKLPGPLASGRDMRIDISYGGYSVGLRPAQGGNYGVLRSPDVYTHVQYSGGILSGPMRSLGSQGGLQRNNSDYERWQRATGFQKGLIHSPQTPLQVMHKAERKYQVGKVTDEEEAKQRQLKAILNKLTPQNFEKLFEQVKAVNIDNADTLSGVISQIFDKALMEPTFCEMYANFCYHLSGELRNFSVNDEKITFKRLLLNKCQEEFERGEREEEEANRAEEEGEIIQSEQEREQKRIQARRRMLGNIRLIGELYKKKMLTEKIMHGCINKLLGQYENPDEEDVEALCKLMSTIGEMIDHSKVKVHMDAYFDRMDMLSNNMKLSSRVRFMLKDAIDLRKNKWQQRRKVEGPKKIDEVHRDAAQERQAQASRLARGSSMNSSVRRAQPIDFGPRGSSMTLSPNASMRGLHTQLRGHGTQDIRSEDKPSFENRAVSIPLPQRSIGSDYITLGPQGGLARGMSFRGQSSTPSISLADTPSPGDPQRMTSGLNGYNSVPQRTAYRSRDDLIARSTPEMAVSQSASDQSSTEEWNMNFGSRNQKPHHGFDRSPPPSSPMGAQRPTVMQNTTSDEESSEKYLRDMSVSAIKEFYSAKDEKEVTLCVKDLNAPSFYPSMISIWVTDSFERKDMERDLLAKLLVNLTKSQDVTLSTDELIKGFESVLATLEDAVNDAPKAAEFLGHIFAKLLMENLIPFTKLAQLVYEGGEEQGRLVEIGLAAEIVGSILEIIKLDKGEKVLNEIRASSGLQLEKFRPSNSNKTLRLDKFI